MPRRRVHTLHELRFTAADAAADASADADMLPYMILCAAAISYGALLRYAAIFSLLVSFTPIDIFDIADMPAATSLPAADVFDIFAFVCRFVISLVLLCYVDAAMLYFCLRLTLTMLIQHTYAARIYAAA